MILSFYFKSVGSEGEINGVGLDNNLGLSSNYHFKVHGTQNWGIRDYDDYSGNDWRYYEIPLHGYFNNDFNYITFSNDADRGQATEVYFKDVEISQDCNPGLFCKDDHTLGYQTEACDFLNQTYCDLGCYQSACISAPSSDRTGILNLNGYTIQSYGGSQDVNKNQYEILDDGSTIRMWGNNWKAIPLPTNLDPDTILSFYFRSIGQVGEINGMGFDKDLGLTSNYHFKVHGTQNWGRRNYDDYSGNDWKYYEIPAGDFLSGNFNYLTFSNDADSRQKTNVYFSFIRVGDQLTCTDNDQDTFAIEGGDCGAIDCNDNNEFVFPGAPDIICDGIDNNCDSIPDDEYIEISTSCGLGVCEASGQLMCMNGTEYDTCTEGSPTGDDSDCDGLDNDCDGTIDEDGNCDQFLCYESDGGDYPTLFGYLNSTEGYYQDECIEDQYGNYSNLMEYYCTADSVEGKEYNCDSCQNGECTCYGMWDCVDEYTRGYKNEDCTFTNVTSCEANEVCRWGTCVFCSDTDGGDNPLTAGTASYTYGDMSDRCSNPSKLIEYYCSPDYYVTSKQYDCDCSNGECSTCFEKTICIDSTHKANQYSDCSYGDVTFCDYGCDYSTGECRFCTDSDGGLNYTTKGKITYGVEGGNQYDSWDSCSYDGNFVYEKYCKGEGTYYGSEYYECPNGCTDGACII
jgi:hypothetical protein